MHSQLYVGGKASRGNRLASNGLRLEGIALKKRSGCKPLRFFSAAQMLLASVFPPLETSLRIQPYPIYVDGECIFYVLAYPVARDGFLFWHRG